MRWISHRTRIILLAVIAFLALLVLIIGVMRVVKPDLNLVQATGLTDAEKPTTFKTKPYWHQLTPAQKDALGPLEQEWNRISVARKKKWLEIAERMDKMSPEERQRFQNRIREWVTLTPAERKEARENYLSTKKLGVKDKSMQWLEYQSLPEEEKKALAAKARKKRRAAVKPSEEKPITVPEKQVEVAPPPQPAQTRPKSDQPHSPDYWR